ncbi:MAG: hypothetical protein KDD34_00035 [Bdellovibrionales bacterium]|nr:hypothetical protein [Bdellovibrionales bacterium]
MICWKTILAALAFFSLVALQVHSNRKDHTSAQKAQLSSPIDGTFQSPLEKMAGK